MKGKLIDLEFSRDGKQRLRIELDGDFSESFDELKEHEVSVEIKRNRKKRSLDANAYCWVLIDKLASKLRVGKVEIYRDLIKNIGGVSTTICVKDIAVKKLIEGWNHNGLGWVADTFPSKIEGCTNVVLYYGSSTYDTKQMHDLINLIVQECKAVGIPTETIPFPEIEQR